MAWYNNLGNIAGTAAGFGLGFPGAGMGFGSSASESLEPNLQNVSTLTPEQQAALAQLIPQLQGAQAPDIIQGLGSYFNSILAGEPAYEINPETTEQFYQQSIYNPAMTEYENVTRPGFLESLGSLHSSSRANLERTSRQDLAQNLSQQRSGLYYQDEMARREALQQAIQNQLAGGQLNLMTQQAQLGQSQIPMQNLLAALGMPATENIVTQPSLFSGLLGGIENISGGYF